MPSSRWQCFVRTYCSWSVRSITVFLTLGHLCEAAHCSLCTNEETKAQSLHDLEVMELGLYFSCLSTSLGGNLGGRTVIDKGRKLEYEYVD